MNFVFDLTAELEAQFSTDTNLSMDDSPTAKEILQSTNIVSSTEYLNNYINKSELEYPFTAAPSQSMDDLESFFNYTLPPEMQFNDSHVIRIVGYSALMVMSGIGNISLLRSLVRRRQNTPVSRVNLMLQHLAVADLLVTFLLMPLEIGWACTVRWRAGDLMCRIMAFFRTFGVFLSGFLLVVISIDRYSAVLHPLTVTSARIRLRKLILIAWLLAGICSFPQAIIFHVEKHPVFQWFEQCVTFDAFPTPAYELAYNLLGTVAMYLGPLAAIGFCYGAIVLRLYKIGGGGQDHVGLGRARTRTLLMTSVIVIVFFLCWTPYNVMSLWYFIDRNSAKRVDHRVQASLFIFAVANSTVNPLVYGSFRSRRSGAINTNSKMSRRVVYRAPFRQHFGRWRCTGQSSSSDPHFEDQRFVVPTPQHHMPEPHHHHHHHRDAGNNVVGNCHLADHNCLQVYQDSTRQNTTSPTGLNSVKPTSNTLISYIPPKNIAHIRAGIETNDAYVIPMEVLNKERSQSFQVFKPD